MSGFEDVSRATLGELAWERHGKSGVTECEVVVRASVYARPAARHIDTTELADWADEYQPLCDHSVQWTPPVVLYRLADVTVCPEGLVITADGRLVTESLSTFSGVMPSKLGLQRNDDGSLQPEQPVTVRVAQPTLLLKRPWWQNYAHWMIEYAALLALLRQSGRWRPDWHIAIGEYSQPEMRRAVYETIAAIVPQANVIEVGQSRLVSFEQLYLTTPVHTEDYQVPASIDALRNALPPPAGSPDLPRLLYIERAAEKRALENQAEIRDICVASGFTPLQTFGLTVARQAQLFAAADVIVGVKGADFANLIFCRDHATILLLSPGDFPEHAFWDLAAQRKLNYYEQFGRTTSSDANAGRNPFRIDPDRFRALLQEALALAADERRRHSLHYGMQQAMRVGYSPVFDA